MDFSGKGTGVELGTVIGIDGVEDFVSKFVGEPFSV